MEGNLSVLDAFAQVFAAAIVTQWTENFSFVHPRVVGWQLGHGHRAGKDIHRALALKWEQTSFARDAITGSQGAAVFLDWVRAWLALPDDTASAQNAVGLLACIGKDLWEAKAEPGVRGEGGMPTLRSGHQYRKHRRGFDGSHMAAPLIAELASLSDRIKELDGETAQVKADVESWLMSMPNIPDSTVPVGANEHENIEVSRWGEPQQPDFEPRPHDDLGTALGGLDFERAARLTGSRFVVSMGWAARLERALVNFFLDRHTRHSDYLEVFRLIDNRTGGDIQVAIAVQVAELGLVGREVAVEQVGDQVMAPHQDGMGVAAADLAVEHGDVSFA